MPAWLNLYIMAFFFFFLHRLRNILPSLLRFIPFVRPLIVFNTCRHTPDSQLADAEIHSTCWPKLQSKGLYICLYAAIAQ